MDFGKVIYVFFSLMSLTSVGGYIYDKTSSVLLFLALGVNLISTVLKIGVKNLLSAELFAASLVADLHLIPATYYEVVKHESNTALALAIGAFLANIISFVFVAIELSKDSDEF
ncbi:MAG: hypothetical protein GXO40_02985 [Epsilonproteobacteria bacterium]|nr:hypothetical protein [Campylobacterota bacterium]